MSLTIIIPAFNEVRFISESVERVSRLGSQLDDFEILVVDDASTDGTANVLDQLKATHVTVLRNQRNRGKTFSIREGLAHAESAFVVVHDADLEYDPLDIPRLLEVARERGGAVYGRRPGLWHRPSRWLLAGGVLLIDLCLFLVYRRWVRDHATCYKLMPTELLRDLELQSNGFEGCVEITAKLHRLGVTIHQVPISYRPRSVNEGKKLSWRHGVTALKAVWRLRRWTPSIPGRLRQYCLL